MKSTTTRTGKVPAAAPIERRFWINTASLDHVKAVAAGGFTQADHGAKTRLSRPQPGDEMVFYSPRTSLQGGKPVQQFTALATITGDKPYQAIVSDEFRPWRLAAEFHPCTRPDAKPLVAELSFITDATHWGLPFRRGLFTIPREDFVTIAAHMGDARQHGLQLGRIAPTTDSETPGRRGSRP